MFNSINKFVLKFCLLVVLLLNFCLFPAKEVNAASLSLSPSSSTVSVGNIFSVKVIVNTEGKSINNAEAMVQFPVDLLEVVSITKSSSIFSLWVEEPSFSNHTAEVILNGGVPNPGYTGSNGTVVSITFKAKKQGTASIIFTDAAVRENDGLGTDILSSKNSSTIQIGIPQKIEIPEITTPVVKNTLPLKPTVVSDTHPNQDIWYSDNTASFSWKIPSGINSVRTLLNKTSNSSPTITYDNSVSQKTLSNLSDGVYYFHIRYSNSTGWGPITHYKIKIDTTPPSSFIPVVRNDGYKNLIKLNARDSTSGIDYYTLKIDNDPIIRVNTNQLIENEYVLPFKEEGNHDIVVTAYDKAKNHTEATTTFSSPKVIPPEISLSSKEIIKGETITVFGKTKYPNKKVEITLQFGSGGGVSAVVGMFSSGKDKKYTQTTSSDGTFSVTTDAIQTSGLVNIWGETVFENDLKSQPSETVYLKVNDTKVVNTFLSLIYPLLGVITIVVLLIALIILIYIGWHKFFSLRKKINSELQNTGKDVHKAMLLLKEELSDQLEMLENTKRDRVLNKKEEVIFNEIKKNIDDIDLFIEKKLKKLL